MGKIIVRLTGGLGNQLHQYAYGLLLAKKTNSDLYLDKEFLTDHSKKLDVTPRDFEINKFEIDYKTYKSIISNHFFLKIINRLKFMQVILNLFKINIVYVHVPLDKLIKRKANLIYLNGITGNYNDYEKEEIFLKNSFKITESFEALTKKVDEYILADGETVAIHIRRTDYLKKDSIHCVLPIEYYHEAIKRIEDKIPKPKFYIFSDDEDFVKNNFVIDNKRFYFKNFKEHDAPFFDFLAIKKCKHQILANSTFSWWGAFLNIYSSKMVVAPTKWLKNDNNSILDNYPKNWILIG